MTYRRQLLLGRGDSSRLYDLPGSRFSVQSIKNRGANENGEKQGYHIHADAKQKRLPAADCVKGCSFHWILRLVFKGDIQNTIYFYNEEVKSLF
jgi:hypothetical protein